MKKQIDLLQEIRYFHLVVKYHSFTKAAEESFISQSAISQHIHTLEEDVGVRLIDRRNRSFDLTPAGTFFYRRTVQMVSDLEQIYHEAKRIAHQDVTQITIGYLNGYSGREFSDAIAEFAEIYPTVKLKIAKGNHEFLYEALRNNNIDIALSDQRRAYSEEFVNYEMTTSRFYVFVPARNPLAKLDYVDINQLKNIPCILISSREQQGNEETYFRDVVGFQGDFLFVESLNEATIMVAANMGVAPVEGVAITSQHSFSVKAIPLFRQAKQITKKYCSFWMSENTNFYIQEFAEILKKQFSLHSQEEPMNSQ